MPENVAKNVTNPSQNCGNSVATPKTECLTTKSAANTAATASPVSYIYKF